MWELLREDQRSKQTFGYGIAVKKRACCPRIPHQLHWHMLLRSLILSTSAFIQSLLTQWESLLGFLCVLDRVLSKQAVNRSIGFCPPHGQDFQHTSAFRIVAGFSKTSCLGMVK